jgi:hypothetical protein
MPRSRSEQLENRSAAVPSWKEILGEASFADLVCKLSIFLFHVTHRKTTLFGKNKILRDNPYGYIPVSEAKAWRQELKQRAIEQGRITQEKLEGAKPDWHGEFLQGRNKRERIDFFTAMDDAGFGRVEAITELVKAVVRSKRETRSKSARRKKGHHGK